MNANSLWGVQAREFIALLEARITNTRGDTSEPCDAPDPDWPSDWDADHRALADEDRVWRQWP